MTTPDITLEKYAPHSIDYNGCHEQAIRALRYLEKYGRCADGGSQFPNMECCGQIADELERSFEVLTSAIHAVECNELIDREFGSAVKDDVRPAGLDLSGEPCRCSCHLHPGVRHIIACCEVKPVVEQPEEPAAVRLPNMPQHLGTATDMFGAKSKIYNSGQMQEYAREAVRLNSVPKGCITMQEVWEAAGGNPGIKPSKAELLEVLRDMDELCDMVCEEKPKGWRIERVAGSRTIIVSGNHGKKVGIDFGDALWPYFNELAENPS